VLPSIARLEADECVTMIERIMAAHPRARTIVISGRYIHVHAGSANSAAVRGIIAAKQNGRIPAHLQFISTNRIDAMSTERLTAMRRAGFRVLGFGIESFSQECLQSSTRRRSIVISSRLLSAALASGVTPFLGSDP